MALWLSSTSASCVNLDNKSYTNILGFEILRMATANGTALFTVMSPYYNKWFIDLIHISFPISSLIAIIAKDITATD